MKFTNPYWSTTTKIELLERWILIHSILYYEFDTSIVQDCQYDSNARQLSRMLKSNSVEARQTQYAYAFSGYDGNTGFYLFSKLNKADKKYLMSVAQFILDLKHNKI